MNIKMFALFVISVAAIAVVLAPRMQNFVLAWAGMSILVAWAIKLAATPEKNGNE